MYKIDTNPLGATACPLSHPGVEITEIARLVAEARRQAGKNQDAFGRMLGVNGQTISNLESGVTKSLQRFDSVRALAELLGRPIAEVVDINRGSAKGDSPDVFVKLPRTLVEKAMPYAKAQGIEVDEYIAAGLEALMRLQGSPDAAMNARGHGPLRLRPHGGVKLRGAAKKRQPQKNDQA